MWNLNKVEGAKIEEIDLSKINHLCVKYDISYSGILKVWIISDKKLIRQILKCGHYFWRNTKYTNWSSSLSTFFQLELNYWDHSISKFKEDVDKEEKYITWPGIRITKEFSNFLRQGEWQGWYFINKILEKYDSNIPFTDLFKKQISEWWLSTQEALFKEGEETKKSEEIKFDEEIFEYKNRENFNNPIDDVQKELYFFYLFNGRVSTAKNIRIKNWFSLKELISWQEDINFEFSVYSIEKRAREEAENITINFSKDKIITFIKETEFQQLNCFCWEDYIKIENLLNNYQNLSIEYTKIWLVHK